MEQIPRRRLQIDDFRGLGKYLPVLRSQNNPATGRDNAALLGQVRKRFCLEIAKCHLACILKDFTDRRRSFQLDPLIGISEGDVEQPRQMRPDRRLAATRQSNQTNSQL